MEHYYEVIRRWVVKAKSVTDATEKAKPGKHIQNNTRRLPTKSNICDLIEIYAKAAVDNSWAGGGHPLGMPIKEQELKDSRKNLYDALEDIFTMGEQ